MNRLQAVIEIIREARRERGTLAGYKRLRRACRALGFNLEDEVDILAHLDYINPDTREPYHWLAEKLAGKAK